MPIVLKSGNLNLLEPSRSVQACNGIAYRYLYLKLGCGGLIPCTRLSEVIVLQCSFYLKRRNFNLTVPSKYHKSFPTPTDNSCYIQIFREREFFSLNLPSRHRSIIVAKCIYYCFQLRTAAFKAYCAIWVRGSNFRYQPSPRVSPRESTQRWKVELWARNIL